MDLAAAGYFEGRRSDLVWVFIDLWLFDLTRVWFGGGSWWLRGEGQLCGDGTWWLRGEGRYVVVGHGGCVVRVIMWWWVDFPLISYCCIKRYERMIIVLDNLE